MDRGDKDRTREEKEGGDGEWERGIRQDDGRANKGSKREKGMNGEIEDEGERERGQMEG